MQALGKAGDAEAAYVFSAVMSISGSMALPVSSFPNMGAASCLVEGFDRRGTEPFELFRSEFGQNLGTSAKEIKQFRNVQNFLKCRLEDLFEKNVGEIPIKLHQNLSKNHRKEIKNHEFFKI